MWKTSVALCELSLGFDEFCLWSVHESVHTVARRCRDVVLLHSWCVLELLRVCFCILYLHEAACLAGGMCKYAQPCGCLCASPQPLPSIIPLNSLSANSLVRQYDRVSITKWPQVPRRQEGFLAERFCKQHQEEGNSRGWSTKRMLKPHSQVSLRAPLWSLNPSTALVKILTTVI